MEDMIMKKTYMKPTQKVIKLRTMGMLMSSGQVTGTGRSIRMDWDDDAEEDEYGL